MDNITDNKINFNLDDDVSLKLKEKEINNNNLLSSKNNINNDFQKALDIISGKEKLEINKSKNSENNNQMIQENSKKMTNLNMPCVYTGEKGGMKGIDHEKIEKIIYETTKNSRIFKRNEEDLAYLKQEVASLEKN